MYVCRRCDAELSRDADACPECGYDPAGVAVSLGAVVLVLGVPVAYVVPPAGALAIFLGLCLLGWSALRTPVVWVG